MGDGNDEKLELVMSVIVDYALMYPDEVTEVCRMGDRDWRFHIGVMSPAFVLRFDGSSQEYRLNNFFVKNEPGERLEKVLRRTYLSALNKDMASCSPKFADFRERVLEHFVKKEDGVARADVRFPDIVKFQRAANEFGYVPQVTATECGVPANMMYGSFNMDLR